jgi:hypothetical protein
VPAALISKESEKKVCESGESHANNYRSLSGESEHGLDVFFTVCARMGKVNAWLL